MNSTRTGKIARLPKAVREELNSRLENGEEGKQLVKWLNSLPEVEASNPIREQNLSEWRHGGYRDWLIQKGTLDAARQLTAEARALQSAGGDELLTDQMPAWLVGRYLVAIRGPNGKSNPEFKVLRQFCHDLVALRRGDHRVARMKLEQDRREWVREKTEAGEADRFRKWAKNPKVREAIFGKCRNDEEREARMREIFGLPAELAADKTKERE